MVPSARPAPALSLCAPPSRLPFALEASGLTKATLMPSIGLIPICFYPKLEPLGRD